jgi:hypothetical protein
MSLPAKVYGSVTAIYAVLFLACATAFGKFLEEFPKVMEPYTLSLGVLPLSHLRKGKILRFYSSRLNLMRFVWSVLRQSEWKVEFL